MQAQKRRAQVAMAAPDGFAPIRPLVQFAPAGGDGGDSGAVGCMAEPSTSVVDC